MIDAHSKQIAVVSIPFLEKPIMYPIVLVSESDEEVNHGALCSSVLNEWDMGTGKRQWGCGPPKATHRKSRARLAPGRVR